jgi:hypothetical protein
MKLILENWNKFITEEELEEGALAGLGLALGLGGAVPTTDAPTPEPTHQVDTQQQQGAEEAVSKVVDNGDGTFSYTAQSEVAPGMSSAARTFGAREAKLALQDAGHDIAGARLTFATSGGVMYVTVTTAAVGG